MHLQLEEKYINLMNQLDLFWRERESQVLDNDTCTWCSQL